MIWKPHVTVAAIIECDGRFLLVEEEADGRRVFNNPAGHLEQGESLHAAVVREVLEETAHHFAPAALVGIYQWRNPANGESFVRATYCGPPGEDAGSPLDPDILARHWLTLDEIRALDGRLRSPLVLKGIEDYLAGIRYPLSVLTTVCDA